MYAAASGSNRQLSISGPASTESKPSRSSSPLTTSFASVSSPADREGCAVRRPGGTGQQRNVVGKDVAERLDQSGTLEVLLDEFAGRDFLVVEYSDPPVSKRVVVAGVEYDLAVE